jgi:hypothetical protein
MYILGTPQEEALSEQERKEIYEFRAAYWKGPDEELTDEEAASLTAIRDKVSAHKYAFGGAGSCFKSVEERQEFTDLFHDLVHATRG